MIADAGGVPLAVTLTGGNRNDVTQLIPLIDAIPPIRGQRGRPLRRPSKIYADRGYDHDKYRRLVRARGITPVIARRGHPEGSGLGQRRWVVERSFAWLHAFKRLAPDAGKLVDWAAAHLALTMRIVPKLARQTIFVVLHRRWAVERTFSWINRCRRTARDYERLPDPRCNDPMGHDHRDDPPPGRHHTAAGATPSAPPTV